MKNESYIFVRGHILEPKSDAGHPVATLLRIKLNTVYINEAFMKGILIR